MRIEMPFGPEIKVIEIALPADNVSIVRSANPVGTGSWAEVVEAALPTPLGARPIRQNDLRGKRVAVITDDWARPTPASDAVPIILRELSDAGAADDMITFITASGMHDPMSRDDLLRKLGPEAMARCRCISHDAGDHDNLAFVGISEQGTPIWVNRAVAEADCKIALGRIFLHGTHGYEGGYKMILPGVSGFETIARNHSFNFSALSVAGLLDNPSRRETDAVGRIVGIDFIINVVVNHRSEPIKAFCGEPMQVHRAGVEYGDDHVWGAKIPAPADIVIASPGSGTIPSGEYDMATLSNAALAAKESGVIICLSRATRPFSPPRDGSAKADPALLNGPRDRFDAMLPTLSLSELVRLHDKRDWHLPDREIQWRIKGVRGKFYRRRALQEVCKRRVVLTDDPSKALAEALAGKDSTSVRVTVLPEGRMTLVRRGVSERFILLLDILGFSELVKTRPAEEIFSIIELALQCAKRWSRRFPYWPLRTLYFSDTFLVYYDGEVGYGQFSALVDVARNMLTTLLANGVPARGAITFGQFEMRDSPEGETIFFGRALVDADRAEECENWIGVVAAPSCWLRLQKDSRDIIEIDEEEDHRWMKRADGALLLNPLGLADDHHIKLKKDLERPIGEWDLSIYPTAVWAFRFLADQARAYADAGDFSSREAAKYNSTLAFLRRLFPKEQYEWLEKVAKKVPPLSAVKKALSRCQTSYL